MAQVESSVVRADPPDGNGPAAQDVAKQPEAGAVGESAAVTAAARADRGRGASKECQAVVMIHGIGEQRPMDTLRRFVEAVLDVEPGTAERADGRPAYYSRPDMFSDSFELRTLTTPGSFRPRTEFIELYWAHRMPTARWGGILDWLRLLLKRWPRDVPRQFLLVWCALWLTTALIVLALAATVYPYFDPDVLPPQWRGEIAAVPLGLVAVLLLVQGVVLSYAGDAATYLSAHPRNVEARQAIRAAGVALLERLHQSGEYDRIVLVGHSLGSVIGYDVLTYAWQRYHEKHACPERPAGEALEAAEETAKWLRGRDRLPTGGAAGAGREAPWEEWERHTRALWRERRDCGSPWLVTDFVTLGSPLAHADLLLARSRDEFFRKVRQRELPACPPVPNSDGGFSWPVTYELKDGTKRTVRVLHHAAWPAVVCWTNLYFPCRFLVYGDVIGGPVSPLFGPGVRDVPLKTCMRWGGLTHTLYWRRHAGDAGKADAPVARLAEALDLWRRGPTWRRA